MKTFRTVNDGTVVVFGRGCVAGKLADELDRLSGVKQVMVICSERAKDEVSAIFQNLPEKYTVSMCCDIQPHVPQELVDRVLDKVAALTIDCIIVFGGGSAIGLGKALTLSTGCKLVAIPTTYSGSEMTNICGITTAEGGKITKRDDVMRPRVVLYDPMYTDALPMKTSVESAVNAIAHAVEAMWATDTDPITLNSALEGCKIMVDALPGLKECADAGVLEAGAMVRDELLYGAYLCGFALHKCKMALHHKMAHVLGGTFGLPHASVHTLLLPFSVAYNIPQAPDTHAQLSRILGTSDVAAALFDLVRSLGGTHALRQLNFKPDDIDRAAALVVKGGALYENPREIVLADITELLLDAYLGRRPPTRNTTRSDAFLDRATGSHAALAASIRGAPLSEASAVIVCIHGRYSSADRMIQMVSESLGDFWRKDAVAFIAPQAADATWYPGSFLKAMEENEPRLSSALSVVDSTLEAVLDSGISPTNVILLGFSQGACLALSYIAKHGTKDIGAVVALSGALTGSDEEILGGEVTTPDEAAAGQPSPAASVYNADLKGLQIVMGCATEDAHVPMARVALSRQRLTQLGADVQDLSFPGSEHKIFAREASAVRSLLMPMLKPLHDPGLFTYLYGLGSVHTSECRPGAVPRKQYSPQDVPHGLYAEHLTGSSFVAPRSENVRCWFYRIHPSVATHSSFKALPHPTFTTNPSATYVPTATSAVDEVQSAVATDDGTPSDSPVSPPVVRPPSPQSFFVRSPEPVRWRPLDIPSDDVAVDFIDGMHTIAGSGDSLQRIGCYLHVFACNASMDDRAFYNSDGSMCIVPEVGEFLILTECGRMHVRVGELFVIPRGFKFSVQLLSAEGRGWVSEVFGAHFRLPERGPLGGSGLADERHFAVPTAWYEDRACPNYRLTTKFGGELHEATLQFSPYDAAGWTGSVYPYKYNMHLFQAYSSVTYDHADPSLHLVLTSPGDEHGNSACDVVAFVPRWDPVMHTFRPPWYHRNQATEFNGIVKMNGSYSGFMKGGSFLTPMFTAHGVSSTVVKKELGVNPSTTPAHTSTDESSIWIMFESTYQMAISRWALDATHRDADYRKIYGGLERTHRVAPM
eukprot:m.529959 g.529959  ORF g.529959 m.529959 type:complete len:1100 (+) comp22023_c0_seq8:112-3411(+)